MAVRCMDFFTLTAPILGVPASDELIFDIDANDDGLPMILWLHTLTAWLPIFFRVFCIEAIMLDVSSAGDVVVSVEHPGFGSDSVSVDGLGVNGDIVAVDAVDIGVVTILSILRLFFASILISVSTLVRNFSSDDSRFDDSMSVSSRPDDGMSKSNTDSSLKSSLLFKFISGISIQFSTFSVAIDDC